MGSNALTEFFVSLYNELVALHPIAPYVALAVVLFFPIFYGSVAKARGRSFIGWAIIGCFLSTTGLIGIILFLIFLPHKDVSIRKTFKEAYDEVDAEWSGKKPEPKYTPAPAPKQFVPPAAPTALVRTSFTQAELDNARDDEDELLAQGNDHVSEAISARKSGRPNAAVSHLKSALEIVALLRTVDEAYYEPTLYAILDELGKVHFHDLGSKGAAREYFVNAYYFCDRCAKRDPSGAASRDIHNIRTYLTDPKYCG